LQIVYFARQFSPRNSAVIKNIYGAATTHPYNYLLVDNKQNTPDKYRLQSGIFANETIIYWQYIASKDFDSNIISKLYCQLFKSR